MLRRETINNSRVPVVQDGSQVDQEHRYANSTPPAVIVRVGTFFHVTFRFCDALMIPSLRR